MKLSTKGRYAVTAMMDLAIHSGRGPVTLSDISQAQAISLSYLEQIFAKLRKAGLVEGVRGPGGGYRLSRPAEEISIASVVDAVGEGMDVTRCGAQGGCQDGRNCLTHDLWQELSRKIFEFLDGISLADYSARPEVQETARMQDEIRGRGEAVPFV
ncbi:MAG: Rrf2 family transcriptional regulator [Gammaproteobacteria bacterium]